MFATRRVVLALSPLAMLVAGSSALAQNAERMEQVVSASADERKFMGAALVAIGDEILLDEGFGSADLEWNIANTPDTKFRIGSVTKQFTAASILLLQERGQLDIDQPVGTYLSDTPASWDAVTLRHLLHHTSGIPNLTDFDDFGTWKYLPTTREKLIARFAERPLEFTPGEKWSYSNSGYLLLSAVVEDASGKPYAEFVEENIFRPLGMTDTAIDVTSAIVPRRAEGYSPSPSGVVNADYVDMGIPQGAGALYSTTHDLLKWQRGLFGGKVVNTRSLAEMTRPAVEAVRQSSYGMGLLVTENEEGTLIWHGGGIEGFNAWLGHDPARDITVVVLANLNGGEANTLGQSLTKLARGGEVTLAGERATVDLTAQQLAEYAGSYAVTDHFKIAFRVEDGALVTQATGQDAYPVFAEGPDRFFLKVVDAQLAFNRNDENEVVSVTLSQGGSETLATRE
ncbi:serine hydrolase [Qipengyuania sp.]|uniref:serine hydrolase n=1 Tax=Qipengyuania sp. TaxID=2004515 RepID=UPI003BAA0509